MADESNRGRRPRVADDEIRAVIRSSSSPVHSTKEIADALPITRRGTTYRLEKLEEQGILNTKKIAGVRVWWDQQIEATHAWPDETNEEKDNWKIGVPVIDQVDLPGSERDVFFRRHSLSAVFRMLFLEDAVSSRKLQQVAWISNPHPTVSSPESLWNNVVRSVLNDSVFTTFSKTSDEWRLTTLGKMAKTEFGEFLLWENWTERERELISQVVNNIGIGLNEIYEKRDYAISDMGKFSKADIFHLRSEGNSTYAIAYFFDKTFWNSGTVHIQLILKISQNAKYSDEIKSVSDEHDLSLTWSEDGEQPQAHLTKDFPITPNGSAFRSNARSGNRPPLENVKGLIEIINDVDRTFLNVIE